jgi:predicted enzyme related to lactoylglutathione lyase
MNTPRVTAVLFARDLNLLAEFYQKVFGGHASHRDADNALLNFNGFELMIHQIPQRLIGSETITSPPERRERSAIRLNFPVADMTYARREAQHLGGILDALPPPWAGADASFYLGHDPEGNVFGALSSC